MQERKNCFKKYLSSNVDFNIAWNFQTALSISGSGYKTKHRVR